MEMDFPALAWYARGAAGHDLAWIKPLSRQFQVHIATDFGNLERAIQSFRPVAVCFDFDVPTAEVMERIVDFGRDHGDLPLILITQARSVSFAIWALRQRVWDYFGKPVDIPLLLESLSRIPLPKGTGSRAFGHQRSDSRQAGSTYKESLNPRISKNIRKAVHFIETHFSHEFSQSEVAKTIGMSSCYFSRSFHRTTGYTFGKYVIKTRIRVACDLLQDRSLPITTVCYETGFRDPSYFSRVFQQEKGMSPSEFRRRHYVNDDARHGLVSVDGLGPST